MFKETGFASLIGGLFMPVLDITAPAPVGPGFIKLLPSGEDGNFAVLHIM